MKEDITDINLPKTPATRDNKSKNQSNCSRLDKWAERVAIVNAKLLGETTGDQLGLVLINRAIGTMLGLEYPLAANNIDSARTRHKNPCLVVMKGG